MSCRRKGRGAQGERKKEVKEEMRERRSREGSKKRNTCHVRKERRRYGRKRGALSVSQQPVSLSLSVCQVFSPSCFYGNCCQLAFCDGQLLSALWWWRHVAPPQCDGSRRRSTCGAGPWTGLWITGGQMKSDMWFKTVYWSFKDEPDVNKWWLKPEQSITFLALSLPAR